MHTQYLTILGESRVEIDKLKGSRFLGCALPVKTEDAALAYLAALRAEFHDARHHCSAWRLTPSGEPWRYSDDGEPSGSAGRPILKQIEGAELSDVAVVVVRWFGGTKLGVGGLVRAYGAAAKAVLEAADKQLVVLTRRVELRYPYAFEGAVQGLLSSSRLVPVESRYGEEVVLHFDVPLPRVDEFTAEFVDRTAGRGQVAYASD
ncbi:MAG: YigZ family protein [Planctomycetes bacterium]|nr:YigZ family protein [Planctomycetota bacterium]MCB9903855.1 YigZ family protein [Planctomycetota bacterium]